MRRMLITIAPHKNIVTACLKYECAKLPWGLRWSVNGGYGKTSTEALKDLLSKKMYE